GREGRLRRLGDAEVGGGDVLLGDRAARDLVDEFVTVTRLRRREVDDGVAELAATAGLANEPPLDLLGGPADRLAIGDLRPADIGVDIELAGKTVDDDLEVELAHPGDQGLARLVVGADAERRGLFREPL